MLMEEHVTRVFDLFVEPIRERERERCKTVEIAIIRVFTLLHARGSGIASA